MELSYKWTLSLDIKHWATSAIGYFSCAFFILFVNITQIREKTINSFHLQPIIAESCRSISGEDLSRTSFENSFCFLYYSFCSQMDSLLKLCARYMPTRSLWGERVGMHVFAINAYQDAYFCEAQLHTLLNVGGSTFQEPGMRLLRQMRFSRHHKQKRLMRGGGGVGERTANHATTAIMGFSLTIVSTTQVCINATS